MPSWFTHLATAKEISDKIGIKDINSFLIGNLMPDAERHVIKDFSIYIPYDISHFASIQSIEGGKDNLPNINKFLDIYKGQLSNNIALGYLVHILTDYYWNNITYSRYTLRNKLGECIGIKLNNGTNLKCNKHIRSKVKNTDFAILEENIIQKGKYILPYIETNIITKTNVIKEVPYNEEDIKKIVKFCEYKSKNHGIDVKYQLFTKEQIEEDYKRSIKFILDYMRGIYNDYSSDI